MISVQRFSANRRSTLLRYIVYRIGATLYRGNAPCGMLIRTRRRAILSAGRSASGEALNSGV